MKKKKTKTFGLVVSLIIAIYTINNTMGFNIFGDASTNENAIENQFIKNKLIEVDGGNLSGHREPNVVVDVGFGDREYWAYTNEFGQLVMVTANKITLQDDSVEPVNSNGRYYSDEAKVPGTERKDLDEGHVIADSLGGVSNAYNITPQNSTLNRHGDQAYMEKVIRDAGGCSNFVAII
ncbi:DNA/RNA non-specific endonuclease, partial [Anaerotignum sp.]|uniref:DNA/RNA non-specific endonuclease n=1 Tax=Anaerotignum sp. TaxID=2039241 RepID=UPI0028992883